MEKDIPLLDESRKAVIVLEQQSRDNQAALEELRKSCGQMKIWYGPLTYVSNAILSHTQFSFCVCV
jgi:hypothetical protein